MGSGGGSPRERVEQFRLVYAAAYPRIVAYALRRARSREDALDAVSETFMTVWRRLDQVPPEPATIPWMFGVARRVLANQYRGADRQQRLETRLAETASPSPADSEYAQVHAALDRLRPDDREILTLSVWDDLDNDEIAVVLGIRPSGVAVRLHRARKRLAAELDRTLKSQTRSRTPEVVYGTQPGPGEVEPE